MKDYQTPAAVEAERALLGGLLTDPSMFAEVGAHVGHHDFYRPEHGHLFRLLDDMHEKGEAVDLVTVAQRMQLLGAERYGGASYVAELPEHCPSTANLTHYAETVRDRAMRRRLIALAVSLQTAAAGQGDDGATGPTELAERWTRDLLEVSSPPNGDGSTGACRLIRKPLVTFDPSLPSRSRSRWRLLLLLG